MNLEMKCDIERVNKPEQKKSEADPWIERIRFIETTSLEALIAMNQKEET